MVKKFRLFIWVPLILAVGGCGPLLPGESGLVVVGQPLDVVFVQSESVVPVPGCCCCGPPFGTCLHPAPPAAIAAVLGEDGQDVLRNLSDNVGYRGFSIITGCGGAAFLPACGSATLRCEAIGLTPLGTITLTGGGVECVAPSGRDICNNGWVRVTIEGVTVSTRVLSGYSAARVAYDLAIRINSDPSLYPIVAATVSGSVVTVSSRNPGVEYAYPWDESCTYNTIYFDECPYRATLSPIVTLAP